jgi:peptidoglycan/LPS O-acetylase OafA/YrhL
MRDFKYRPDVDGLRAIAVAMVLLFHGNLGFPGGFVGVDVFFVISGYLITGLILKECDAGTFRFASFWSRRVRRILPASSVMVLVSLIAGAYFLLPLDFRALGTSAVAQQLMLANVFFWFTTGYFDSAAELKPLLHCWSLAVEEQFYLIYPLLLVALHRLRRVYLIATLGTLAASSLLLSEYYVRLHPQAAFFLLPMRAWELLLGGLACLLRFPKSTHRFFLECIGLAGLACILTAGLWYTPQTVFPGLSALLPCLGTVALISANSSKLTSLGRFLAAPPLVFVGLISYSLYLWHWPVLVFARHRFGMDLPPHVTIPALALSSVLAYFSWKFIETPLRRPVSIVVDRKRVLALLCTVPLLALGSYAIRWYDGLPWRASQSVKYYIKARESAAFIHGVTPDHVERGDVPLFGDANGPQKCLLWGDSHAMAAAPGLDAACKDLSVRGMQVTYSATAPLVDFVYIDRHGLREQGLRWGESVCTYVDKSKVDAIVLAGLWSQYAIDPDFEKALINTLDRLSEKHVSVGIMLDVARQDGHVPDTLARLEYFQSAEYFAPASAAAYAQQNGDCNSVIRRIAQGRAHILDPSEYLTNSQGEWFVQLNDVIIYRDAHHLTVEGGLLLRPMFAEFLQQALREKPIPSPPAPKP